jgi:hypothetical protein
VLAFAHIAIFQRLRGCLYRWFVSDSRRPWLVFPCAFLEGMPKAGPPRLLSNSIASNSAHAHLVARVAAAL